MDKINFEFSIEKVVKVIKRFAILILVFAIAFYAFGYFLTKRSTSVSYYSYTDLYIHTIAQDVDEYAKYIETEAKYVDTYLLTINTYKFYEQLRLQLPEEWQDKVSAGQLKGSVSTSKREESAIIRFSVYSVDKNLTEAITQTLSTYMDDYLADNYGVNSVVVVEEPRPASRSVYQSKYLSLIFAAVGILLAFAFGYIKETIDTRIKSVADLESYSIPVLGVVPDFYTGGSKKTGRYAYSGYERYSDAGAENEKLASEKKNKDSKK